MSPKWIVSATAAIFSVAALPAAAQEFSAEAFGGVRFEDNLESAYEPYDTDSGTIFGLRGLYHATPNLGFGLELNATSADYTAGSNMPKSLNARSVMAIARYSTPVSNTVDVYGTLGLGAVRVEFDDGPQSNDTGSDTVAGGQLTLGAAMDIGPQVGLFGEFTYQTAFDDATIVGYPYEYESKNIAVGLRYRF